MNLQFVTDASGVFCKEHDSCYWGWGLCAQGWGWNNYGAQPDLTACQLKCIRDYSCNYVVYRPANRFCTKYSSCAPQGRNWGWTGDEVYKKK